MAHRAQRGEEVFAHRSRQRTPINGSVNYRVLTRARGRCECCGRDGCIVCALEGGGRVLLKNVLAPCITDAYPVREGESLVIPRRHGADGMELQQPEWNAVVELLRQRREMLRQRREMLNAQDGTISGWGEGGDCWEAGVWSSA